MLTQAIINQFNTPKNQTAQFIFTTHNTNLLSQNILRRDQIYFVEKDKYGAAKLYSLAVFKSTTGTNHEINYLKGRYGAIPFISSLLSPNELLNHKNEKEEKTEV